MAREIDADLIRKICVVALYIALIPFINWTFSLGLGVELTPGWAFNPATIATGMVLVVRDFVQREIGHNVLYAMAAGLVVTVFVDPGIALASGTAFAIAEMFDWVLFTFTKYRLSTRILLSSAIAAPVDSTVFLYLAEDFTGPNVVMSIFGKMIGAIFIAWLIRRRERENPDIESKLG